MLVQCPECNTKYNLNENQIAPEGSKVRCVRCKNVFTAFRSQVGTEPETPAVAGDAAGLAENQKPAAPAESAPPRPAPAADPSFADDLEQLLGEKSGPGEPALQPRASTARSIEDDLDQLLADATAKDQSRPAPASQGMSFEDELDGLLAGKTEQAETPVAPRAASFEDELDDLFAGKKDTSAPQPAGKSAGTSTEASFEDDLEQLFAERKSEAPPKPAAASRPGRDVAIDEVDDFFVEKKKSASPRASSKDDMVADLEGAFQQPLIDKTPRSDLLAEDDRPKAAKKSGRFGLIVTILLLLIMATGAGIYVKFVWMPARDAARNSTAVDAGGETVAPTPASAAQIALENVRQYFVPNEKEGQLFIIEGKAVNRFPEPKELLRLKASLYDKQGNVVTSQEFMCGNVVTLYQLQVSSRQDIETALGAKVGILAHNTNIQPGASAPFMVVFFGAPETVEEFGLEVVQSQSPQ